MDTPVAIVIVLYNPSLDQIQRINSFADAKTLNCSLKLIIVDNSYKINYIEDSSNIYYISNRENKGIAYAQNMGINKAKQLGCRFICFFDQDSEYSIDYVERIVNEYNEIKQNDKFIACLGPTIVDAATNNKNNTAGLFDKSYSKVDTIISSGSIVEVDTVDIIGTMEDDLFIDLVDHEWCWRAKSFGYNCYQTSSVTLKHKVGICNGSICGFPIIISAPFRYYYKYRNFILMLRRSYVPFKWKAKNIIRKAVEFICIPIITKDTSIYKYMFNGIKDGLTTKSR